MTVQDKIPDHVAIIMDGNGRWAKEKGMERYEGHRQGVESVRTVLKAAHRHGIKYLTLYVFSTENWGRPQEEVDMLMELLCRSIVNEMDELKKEGIRVRALGDRAGMPEKVIEHLDIIERGTADCTSLNLQLALNYSSRSELVHAARILAEKTVAGVMTPEEIDATTVSSHLYTDGIPDPDLIIRTGGEQRLSNFLLWQGAYSELYFTKTYWPDFGDAEFDAALTSYAGRERRFGLVSDCNTEN